MKLRRVFFYYLISAWTNLITANGELKSAGNRKEVNNKLNNINYSQTPYYSTNLIDNKDIML